MTMQYEILKNLEQVVVFNDMTDAIVECAIMAEADPEHVYQVEAVD